MGGYEVFIIATGIATCLVVAVISFLLWIWDCLEPAPAASLDPLAAPASHASGTADAVASGADVADPAGTACVPDVTKEAGTTDTAGAAPPEQRRPSNFSTLPSSVQQNIAARLTRGTDLLALLRVCKAGRDAVLRGAPHVTLILPLTLEWAVLHTRVAGLARTSLLRPNQPLRARLELSGDKDYRRHCADHVSWMMQACMAEVGVDHTWDVTLKGLLLGNQLVPDYLASTFPTLSALHLVGCYVSHAPPMAAQPGGVVHAALEHLTIDGGFKPAAGGNQLSAQLLTDMLRQQLPSLPNLHSVTIKAHNAADCASMPQAGVLGPQLRSLHTAVTTYSGLTAWRQSLQGYTATLTQLTHLHLDFRGPLWHADMQLLLQLQAVTHLTIPECELGENQSLAHLPCSWQQLCINLHGSTTLDLDTFVRLPLASLQQPVQLVGDPSKREMAVHFNDPADHPFGASAADMQALAVRLQHCGGISWPQGVRKLGLHGGSATKPEYTNWLLAALPLLPRTLASLSLYHMEFSQPLLHVLAERWGSQLSKLSLSDCHVEAAACGQLLACMPHITELELCSYEADAHGRQRLHDNVVEVCSSTTQPLAVIVGRSGSHDSPVQDEGWAERLQAAVSRASTQFSVWTDAEGEKAGDWVHIQVR